MLLALPGGGGAAVALANEREPGAMRWWISRANRAAEIAEIREHNVLVGSMGEGGD